jgi:hypothetical protein
LKGPNFKLTAHMQTSPNEAQATGHESRLMKNEPNFKLNMKPTWFMGTPNAPTKYEKGIVFYYHLFQKNQKFYKKFQKNTQTPSILPPLFCCFFITFHSFSITFTLFSALFRLFSNFWTKRYLSPCTSKTYITFYQEKPFKLHKIRSKSFTRLRRKKCKTNPISFKPKLRIHYTIYPSNNP